MKTISFSADALEDFMEIMRTDKAMAKKIQKLIKECLRTPYEGTGEPEALKYELSGKWSRKINLKDRLVYEVKEDQLFIISCKGHYD